MPKTIEFTTNGCCSALGNFESGDLARNLPDALADHLVKDAQCARYVDVATLVAAAPKAPAIDRPRRTRKPAPEFPPADRDAKGGENNPLTMADAEADLAGLPRPE